MKILKYFALLILAFGSALHAQPGPYIPLMFTATNPAGVACSTASPVLNYTTTGILFTCQSGVYTAATGAAGITSMTTGAVDPTANCAAPSTTVLVLYTQTVTQDIWACVATNTWKKILSTLNTGGYVATGATATAPSRPSAGNLTCYYSSVANSQICLDSGSGVYVVPQTKDCTGTGHVLSINADATVTCSADSGSGVGTSVTSSTPVTANANSTSEQFLMELPLIAGYLNSLGQPFLINGAFVYTTPAAQTPTITINVRLCTVSGCGSGTNRLLSGIVTTATIASVTNNPVNINFLAYNHAIGATGTLEVHGPLSVDLGALTTTADSIFNDVNTAVSGTIDLTAALYLDFSVTFSTNAAGANSITQRAGGIMPFGATAAPSGTVSVVGAGTLTSGACMTGGGSQLAQTPTAAANCGIDASGNIISNSYTSNNSILTTSYFGWPGKNFLGSSADGLSALLKNDQITLANLQVNTVDGYTVTATAAGTTTLTVASTKSQRFTGATTQAVTMPVTSTLLLGQEYEAINDSTGAVTVNSSGGNAILVLAASTRARFTVILTSGTSAASWAYTYWGVAVTSGKKFTVSNSLTVTSTDGSTAGFGAGGTVTYTIASGTSALGTSSINSQACATVVTTSAIGTLSTDAISWTPNASIKAVTGYAPLTTGGLSITPYPTADNVNFDVCNWSGSAITPGAVTLNWRVVR